MNSEKLWSPGGRSIWEVRRCGAIRSFHLAPRMVFDLMVEERRRDKIYCEEQALNACRVGADASVGIPLT